MIEVQLGAFLRRRREATSPADVGLPYRVRRRTPGRRRSELATLAGVIVDYPIRLEQGRDTRPSETLDLPGSERQRLVVHLAAGAAMAAGLDRAVGRKPGALRSVTAAPGRR